MIIHRGKCIFIEKITWATHIDYTKVYDYYITRTTSYDTNDGIPIFWDEYNVILDVIKNKKFFSNENEFNKHCMDLAMYRESKIDEILK